MRELRRVAVLLSLAGAVLSAPGARAAGKALPFLADDYAKALAEARERQLPLFVEAWAPW